MEVPPTCGRGRTRAPSSPSNKLRYMAHALAENRNGLIVDVETTQANGRAEREVAQAMMARSVR
ncbi:hypothetical protein [Parachitinimonas caeni]|uniref:Uncharacterized protein n=1 Tax=Parachitinimonas caeni TaxID=3031301 RepID=A0ABT7E3A2_9NEIS|nr:hypothetical protein [Parachitinimonas caeni]MDK2126802.1 hypothetical protein [Parachitinimonas caeni]